MKEDTFTLYDLIQNNDIKGLIFDKFGQKHHFRLFPYKQKLFGSFEAYVYSGVDVRHKTKKLKNLILNEQDKKVILFAFLHREEFGTPDGMGSFNGPDFITARFSPGTREDNYIFDNKILTRIYSDYDLLLKEKRPLPKSLSNSLSLTMSTCYFDKVPIKGKGSICYRCASELRKEGYSVPNSYIARLVKKKD
jgi:hypothetical protein